MFRHPVSCKLHCRKQVKCFKVLCPVYEHTDANFSSLLQVCFSLSALDGEVDGRSKRLVKEEQRAARSELCLLQPRPERACDQCLQSDDCVRQVAVKQSLMRMAMLHFQPHV